MSRLDKVMTVFDRYPDVTDTYNDNYYMLDYDYLSFVRDIRYCYPSYVIPKFQNYRFRYHLNYGYEPGYFVSENNIINTCTHHWYIGSDFPIGNDLLTPIMIPVLFEDIPTIKFLMTNHFTNCPALVLLIVGNVEIIHLLLEYNLPTEDEVSRFIRYMIKEVELFHETQWDNLFETFVNHASILNWLSNQININVKPYYGAINNYDDMISCLLHFYKYADIWVSELIPFEFAIVAIRKSSDNSRGLILKSFAYDVDKFKRLYKPEYIDNCHNVMLTLLKYIDTLRYVLSFPMSDELYKYLNRMRLYEYVHADNFIPGLYEIYLKNMWMKVVFTETSTVMKTIYVENALNMKCCDCFEWNS